MKAFEVTNSKVETPTPGRVKTFRGRTLEAFSILPMAPLTHSHLQLAFRVCLGRVFDSCIESERTRLLQIWASSHIR